MRQLNAETMKYGIKFPINEVQFGRVIHFLDLCIYLDENNRIHYCGYAKPTDAKRYLNPLSFHPASVFNSIPFSQLLRTLRNNSKIETRNEELLQCVSYFKNSGYNPDKLQELKEKAIIKHSATNTPSCDADETLVFPVHYFHGIGEFKKLVRSLDDEIKQLVGDTRIMLALKKSSSIGNRVVWNKQLCFSTTTDSQKCHRRGCLQCPQVNEQNELIINGNPIRIPRHLNCKSRNVIYMWVCKICGVKEVYFGRTTQECHDRTSGHRGCFNEEKWEKSASSMHAREVRQMHFSLKIFSISVVSKVSPQQLRREEFKYIKN